MTPTRLDIFNGDVSSLRSTVYANVALPTGSDPRHYALRGTVEGPYSDFAQTLPAKYPLQDCGPGESLLSMASLPDPCVWTPGMPVRYRLEYELSRDAEPVEKGRRTFGIRDLRADGQSVVMAGKRIVIRGVDCERTVFDGLSEWRDSAAAMLVRDPDEFLCDEASREGVIVLARMTHSDDLADRLRRIAAHPSVAVVWLDSQCADHNWRQLAPHALIAKTLSPDGGNGFSADVFIWEITASESEPESFRQISKAGDKPVIAVRPLPQISALAAARAACDELQRDLAPQFDLAGYLV